MSRKEGELVRPTITDMKRILLIGTGGTIALELTDSGLVPELNSEQLLNVSCGTSLKKGFGRSESMWALP